MDQIDDVMAAETGDDAIASLIRCATCAREMRLFGIEPSGPTRELYTFECETCDEVEVRGVRIGSHPPGS